MYSISSSDKIKRCPCCGNQYPTETRENNTVYVHCGHCGFKTKEYYYTDKQKAIDEWNNSDSPWHTGTPTEAGLYVIAYRFGNKIEHEIREMYYSPDYGMTFGIKKDIVAWQKIEPYKETE